MIEKFTVAETAAVAEFGMSCQRLIPWDAGAPEPPAGLMACFLHAGGTSEPDCHDQNEVMLVLTGDGEVEIEDERTTVLPNQLLMIPRNRTHVVHNTGEVTLSWVSLYWPLHEPTGDAG